ncbi:MAG TPA: TRAP transporter large permease [Desulfobacteraceae bacterium]|nr:TRAP transporter large permease [Desulfobacteraceae bacterium]HPJ66940.1 TRAP transporter large permease [Desulfobacteraceae bacterium]HPQ27674.1 TRAP transporter large permease [Desulfobacteraceae bacterium]
MNPTTVGLIGLAILVIFLFSRMPVAFVMGLLGVVGFSYVVSFEGGMRMLAKDFFDIFGSYSLTVVPLFMLMGQITFHAGISSRLFDTAYKLIGHLPGGLAMAAVAACAGFAAICGSTNAAAATMGTVALPEMKRYKYDDELATGTIAAGGSLGILIPPSVIFIVYGILTEQSIGSLFIAGIVPGILLSLLFVSAIYVWVKIKPETAPRGPKTTLKEKLVSLAGVGDTLILFILVMGGLFAGFFTPTEAGAVGAGGAILLGFIRRRLTWKGFIQAAIESTRISCMVLVIVAGATMFGHFLAITRIPFALATWVSELAMPHWAIMAFIIFLYLVGGAFVDALALILLTIPIFYPVVTSMGYDPIWFGVIIVLVTQMGVITPPVGVNVYIVNGIAKDVPLMTIFRGAVPFLIAIILCSLIMIPFPQIALFLPKLMN